MFCKEMVWLKHATRDILFHTKCDGRRGVPNVEWIYTVQELARASLFLDMRRNMIPVASELVSLTQPFRASGGNPMARWTHALLAKCRLCLNRSYSGVGMT